MNTTSCNSGICQNLTNATIPPNQSLFGPTFIVFLLGTTVGIIPNIIIFAGIYRKRSLHKPTYYFIANLAICDLVLSIATLFNAALNAIAISARFEIHTHSTLCKFLTSFPVYWSYTASIETLIFICFERYIAVFKPMMKLTNKKSKHLCFIAWIISLIISFPTIITTRTNNLRPRYCVPFVEYTAWTGIFNMTLFILQFFLPALIMITVYSLILHRLYKKNMANQTESDRSKKKKRRTIYMLIITTIIFLAFSAPWSLTLAIVAITGKLPYQLAEYSQYPTLQFIITLRRLMLPFTSLYNPFVYCIFQKQIRQLLFPCTCCNIKKKLSVNVEPTSQSRTDLKSHEISKGAALCSTQYSQSYQVGAAKNYLAT
ncbi:G-protein coupled receptor 15 [Trichoplax sp. H2]|nr:G-protein coupled receptor 15 [Trichoplax sp. H2]|eukprot:RDD36155.1 G-protein coupled receptor 15 [Trichoplax sp. H2]